LASRLFSYSGFAGTDSTHDNECKWLRTACRVPQRETKIARRLFHVLVRFHRFGLHRLNAFDFSPHKGAITLVEIRDLQHSSVAELMRGISEKQVPQIAAILEVEIHR